MHSFGTPSITPYSVIPPSCPALSTAPVVVAIGPVGSVPIGRGGPYGTVRSVVRSELWSDSEFRLLGLDFRVGLWGRTFESDFRGLHTGFVKGEVKGTISPSLSKSISQVDGQGKEQLLP